MTTFEFKGIYFKKQNEEQKWIEPGFVTADEEGLICSIDSKNISNAPVNQDHKSHYLIPGFQNAHSHAFQYAMVSLAEGYPEKQSAGSTHGNDDFWSWRDNMYRLALKITPDQMEKIAGALYAQMVANGYTHVCEFHYLHHDLDGKPYSNPGEMMERLAAAAESAQIGITLIPVFYREGGFNLEPSPQQRRFISKDVDTYFKLVECAEKISQQNSHVKAGCGIHSLRAASEEDTQLIFQQRNPLLPFHMHIAEQMNEVRQCKDARGAPPIRWLLNHFSLDQTCHFIHATHLEEEEMTDLAKTGAQVVVCPSTEGNLGDGFFNLDQWENLDGGMAIGSDSQVGLSPMEEIRWLDYGQRLRHQKRLLRNGQRGETLFNRCLEGGLNASQADKNQLNGLVISHPLLEVPSEKRLSAFIFSGDRSMIKGHFHNGNWLASEESGKKCTETLIPLRDDAEI